MLAPAQATNPDIIARLHLFGNLDKWKPPMPKSWVPMSRCLCETYEKLAKNTNGAMPEGPAPFLISTFKLPAQTGDFPSFIFRSECANLREKRLSKPSRQELAAKLICRAHYPASSATPPATSAAAIHRRRSTFSCRKILAANALPIKVSDAAAGATRLTSPHDNENSRLKNATAIAATPRKKFAFDRIRPTTVSTPERFSNACTSPTCFMARAIRMSPTTEKNTTIRIPPQV